MNLPAIRNFTLAILALSTGFTAAQPIPKTVTFRNYFGSMVFNRPVLFLQYPGQDSTHIVLQQNGRIVTVRRIGDAWAKTDSALITVTAGDNNGYYEERGLLGFAFHPDFATNRKYYVCYFTGTTAQTRMTTIEERTADITLRPKTVDPQRVILTIPQTADNHNGGTLGFGPDGYLYHATGDGGNSPDPNNYAQNRNDLRGKVLRIDVDKQDPGLQYAVPADNPFVGVSGTRPEVWAYGFRNPWKWTFHPLTGQLWVADVGLTTREEINIVAKGANHGWRVWEGSACREGSTACNALPGTALPVLEFPRTVSGSNFSLSITGGAFFMGHPSSAYFGVYIFGDYITNRVWAMRVAGGTMTDTAQIGTVNNVVSFDRDSRGRVFAVSAGAGGSSVNLNSGVVYILESPDMVPLPVGIAGRRPFDKLRDRFPQKTITLAMIRRDPARYELRALDGRRLSGIPSGAFVVRDRVLGTRALMTATSRVL